MRRSIVFTFFSAQYVYCYAFSVGVRIRSDRRSTLSLNLSSDDDNIEWTSDFDDFIQENEGEGDALKISSIFKSRSTRDLSAIQTRQFSLGPDLILSDFVGKMGFDEVTDWEYYYQNEEDPADRKVVQPNPFDSSKPKRTRKSSGSVVRVFRGEFSGTLGGSLRAKGIDNRVLVKEFTGEMALKLARYELLSIGKLQSDLVAQNEDAMDGLWIQIASSRTITARKDDQHVGELLQLLKKAPYLGILGEVNLAELEGEMDPNEFYRALGVPPPKPDAIWIVYEYAGLNTVSSYAVPPQIRRSKIPPKRTLFGTQEPPPIPSFDKRANYIVSGIMKGAIEALATLHESGIAHRSIGRSSVILTSQTQDKAEPSSVYATQTNLLSVKLADFGFSGLLEESTYDEEFLQRARSFGLSFRKGDTSSLAATNFAMAEDLHALGFVILGLLLSSLADIPRLDYPIATDEDTLQRLLGEIFDKDVSKFREYLEDDPVYKNLVLLLDENNGAGWTVLETLFQAREKAAENKNSLSVITARGILSNPFFKAT